MRGRRATVQWRHLVNWREAARCGEWPNIFQMLLLYPSNTMAIIVAIFVRASKNHGQTRVGVCRDTASAAVTACHGIN